MEKASDSSDSGPPSSRSRSEIVPSTSLSQLNSQVYEVCKPIGGPTVELVFFHGIQREEGTHEPHLKPWSLRGNNSELWLPWLFEPFPDARILIVGYDAALKKTDTQGNMDIFLTSENLLVCLSQAKVGESRCPVILVGHCIGGLVIKELLSRADSNRQLDNMQKFLNSVQGIFFYATPHQGTNLSAYDQNGSLFEYLKSLNKSTARLNDAFTKLRQTYEWQTAGVAEGHETNMGCFKGKLVPEASARHDLDGPLYTIAADHFDVCRPIDESCSGFHQLSDFIHKALQEGRQAKPPQKDFSVKVVGVETNLEPILRKLDGTRRLGIVGMGGIGKSTVAKILFDKIEKDYEYTCFVDEIKKQVTNNDTVDKLRAVITNAMKQNGYKVKDTFHWATLRNKRVLMILDDVDSASHVAAVTQEDHFSRQSRLITTSRDSRVLVPYEFEIYQMKMIDSDDAERLLCRHAFEDDVAPQNIQKWVKLLAEKCGNLPLALKVVGGHLLKRADNEKLWEEALEKIKGAKTVTGDSKNDFWSILELSFDALARDEQEMFLDIATCFHGEILKDVTLMWKTWLSSAELTWQNLVDKSLVSLSRDDRLEKWRISMHELHRDLGQMKANPDPDDVATHTRVSDVDKFYKLLEKEQEVVAVKILRLPHCSELRKSPGWLSVLSWKKPQCDMRRWTNLKIVSTFGKVSSWDLEGVEMRWEMRFPPSLRYARLPMYVECIFGIETLRYLRLNCMRQTKHLPSSLSKLIELESLEICDPSLEGSGYSSRKLPKTLGQLSALSRLFIDHCGALTELPESLGQLAALSVFEISWCNKLRELPDSLGRLSALSRLSIKICESLRELPESLGQLSALSVLRIKCCNTLMGLPESLGRLSALSRLSIKNCRSLKELPDSLGQLSALSQLEICTCRSLTELPKSLGHLLALSELEISSCSSLTELPKSLGHLSALSVLTISLCDPIRELPDSFGQLLTLTKLVLELSSLEKLPESIGQLVSLKHLTLRGSFPLPTSLGQLRNLEDLSIRYCETDLGFVSQANALNNLTITAVSPPMLPLCIRQSERGSVTLLTISCCEHSEIAVLPNSLEYLKILACGRLRQLPDFFGQLSRLRELVIENCWELRHWRPMAAHVGAELQELRFVLDKSYVKHIAKISDEYICDVKFLRQDLEKLVKEGKSLLEGAMQMKGVMAQK